MEPLSNSASQKYQRTSSAGKGQYACSHLQTLQSPVSGMHREEKEGTPHNEHINLSASLPSGDLIWEEPVVPVSAESSMRPGVWAPVVRQNSL
jgi:hypothetical protein